MAVHDELLTLKERKLDSAKSRCEVKITAWLEEITLQLTEVGKELLREVETTVSQLMNSSYEGSSLTDNDLDLNFIPKQFDKSYFGFLCHGSFLPSSFNLELLTRLPDIEVGATINFLVEGQEAVSKLIKSRFKFSVINEHEDVPLNEEPALSDGGRNLQLSFNVPIPGHYTVSARLFNQHVTGSPLVIPVFESAQTGLAQIGLQQIKDDLTKDTSEDECGLSTDVIKTRLNYLMPEVNKPKTPGLASEVGGIISKKSVDEVEMMGASKWNIGNDCIARWAEDGKWYNAVVDTVFKGTPAKYLVRFVDYGNFEIVYDDGLAVNADTLPVDQLDKLDKKVVSARKVVKREMSSQSVKTSKIELARSNSNLCVGHDATSQFITPEIRNPIEETTLDNVTTKVASRSDNLVKGAEVIAKREEDQTWYKAVIFEVAAPGRLYIVKFLDNDQFGGVTPENIVLKKEQVPPGSKLASDVSSALSKKNVDVNVNKNPGELVVDVKNRVSVPKETPKVNAACDESKHTRRSESVTQAKLLVNAVEAAAGSCKTARIPPCIQCSLCRSVCREAMRLVCDSAPVCLDCAVEKFTKGKVCWQCGAKNITKDTHFIKDRRIRLYVEEFIKNGKLSPSVDVKPEKNVAAHQEHEHPVEKSSSYSRVEVDENCLVRFPEGGNWYNGLVTCLYEDGSAQVYFTDFGNSERVKKTNIVRNINVLPPGAKLDESSQKRILKKEVDVPLKNIDFLSLKSLDSNGNSRLVAKQTVVINDLNGPVGVTVLADGSVAIVCRSSNCVARYSRQGVFLGKLRPKRDFITPTDILTLANGGVAVRDEQGIQLFDRNLEFTKFVGEEVIDRCFGLAQDGCRKLITINCNVAPHLNMGGGSKIKITKPGKTDIFFIDIESNQVVKRVEMEDLIESAVEELQNLQTDMSACRAMTFYEKKLYVVDMGLDCVFILNEEGTESEMFGSRGTRGREFRDPTGIVVDDVGTMMVVDSRNHRLQLIDQYHNFAGLVEVDTPLSRPSGIFLDRHFGGIIVSNYLKKSVAIYKLFSN